MKYDALFVIFEKVGNICNPRLLQIIGGALRVNPFPSSHHISGLLSSTSSLHVYCTQ